MVISGLPLRDRRAEPSPTGVPGQEPPVLAGTGPALQVDAHGGRPISARAMPFDNSLIGDVDTEAPCTYDEGAKSADLAQEPETSVDGSRDTGYLQRFAHCDNRS